MKRSREISTNLLELPREVLQEIFLFIYIHTIETSIRLVCKEFDSITQTSLFYKLLMKEQVGWKKEKYESLTFDQLQKQAILYCPKFFICNSRIIMLPKREYFMEMMKVNMKMKPLYAAGLDFIVNWTHTLMGVDSCGFIMEIRLKEKKLFLENSTWVKILTKKFAAGLSIWIIKDKIESIIAIRFFEELEKYMKECCGVLFSMLVLWNDYFKKNGYYTRFLVEPNHFAFALSLYPFVE